ncbi:hypothetical protein HAX54_009015 [Datura stramonium]|uniref:Uncharacterized protein n=1 Tax=Datura stramonium TaxID=4076 RepID=A0ABS8TG22_DATST|nr:hypothetical protein [Datura stramonium]
MLESSQYRSGNTSLPYGIIVTRIIKAMGVDISSFPVKEISSTYNNQAFSSMGYILDEGVWVNKASYKPKIRHVSPDGPSCVKIDEDKRKDSKSTSCNDQEDIHKSNQRKTKHPFEIRIHHSQGNQIIKEGKRKKHQPAIN